MPSPNISTFSLTHVGILDGTTGAEVADLYGVNEGSLEIETDSFDRTGDDKILSTAYWITKGSISVSSDYLPLDMMALLYGTPVVSGASGLSMQLWTEKGQNIQPRPVVVQAPGEDHDGLPYAVKFVLYKVKFGQVSLPQFASYKEGMRCTFEGTALMATKDEMGADFTDGLGARIARIVSQTV